MNQSSKYHQRNNLKYQLISGRILSGKPRAYQVASRIATQDLEGLFKEATTVTEKLDKVMKRFKRTNASFYNGYLAARTIVDN